MAKQPFFPFFYEDFICGTQFFTDATVGCYVRCLCVQWDKGFVESEIFEAICHNLTLKERGKLFEKFVAVSIKDKTGLQNKRMEEARKYVNTISKINSKNGKLGGYPAQKRNHTETSTETSTESITIEYPPNPNLKSKSKSKFKRSNTKTKSNPLTSWPKEFSLTESMIAYAEKKGVHDPEDEFCCFKNWADQHEKKFKDWVAAWRTRCDHYTQYSGNKKSTEGGYG